MVVLSHEHGFFSPFRVFIWVDVDFLYLISKLYLTYPQAYQLIHHFTPLLWLFAPLSSTFIPYYPKNPVKSSLFRIFKKYFFATKKRTV